MASNDGHAPPAAIVLRPLGSGLGLSLGGLAIASLLMGGFDLGWVPVADARQVGLLLVVTVVPLQAVGAVFALLARDGATGGSLALLAAMWAAVAATHMAAVPGSTSPTLGLVELAGGALILLSAQSVARSKLVPAAAIALSGAHFALGGIYELSASSTWQDISGVVSLVVVALAGYAAWAAQMEDAAGHPVAPIGRRNEGRVAVAEPLAAQLNGVAHEPGVRRRL